MGEVKREGRECCRAQTGRRADRKKIEMKATQRQRIPTVVVGTADHASSGDGRLAGPGLSYCRIDAAGVPAEWVEAGVATKHQPTMVCFLSSGGTVDALEQIRPSAWDLAMRTGARVLSVACSACTEPSPHTAAVKAGLTAYAWLLSEGCDLDRTTFAHEPGGGPLVEGIRVGAVIRGLPVPAYDTETTIGSLPVE